ncbi:hypothetical protein B9Z19DRAFT_1131932 [Tuber borchii]|uniref:Uncharacterized protein n=1 Tax=Tuber borchii TaxID=42251 RepID=A0A2T6ZHX1_TUBBO|nr:hypothetical protein B9Z19DRAFT_1131932 [Tuber borchii]
MRQSNLLLLLALQTSIVAGAPSPAETTGDISSITTTTSLPPDVATVQISKELRKRKGGGSKGKSSSKGKKGTGSAASERVAWGGIEGKVRN